MCMPTPCYGLIVMQATRARSPGNKTPGDLGTPEPSTTNNCWPSRAKKSPLEGRLKRPTGRSPKNATKMLQESPSETRLKIVMGHCRWTDLRHLELSERLLELVSLQDHNDDNQEQHLWNLHDFCTICTVSTHLCGATGRSSTLPPKLNLRLFQVIERLGLLELQQREHKNVNHQHLLHEALLNPVRTMKTFSPRTPASAPFKSSPLPLPAPTPPRPPLRLRTRTGALSRTSSAEKTGSGQPDNF